MTAPRTVPELQLTEKQFQAQIIELARLFGWRVAHFRPGMTRNGRWATQIQGDGAGFPDLLLVRGRSCVVAELKTAKGKLTAAQEEWLAAFSLADIPAYIWRPEQWEKITRVLR
jgi:VRR-NUC domain